MQYATTRMELEEIMLRSWSEGEGETGMISSRCRT